MLLLHLRTKNTTQEVQACGIACQDVDNRVENHGRLQNKQSKSVHLPKLTMKGDS
jgi:hypothetical protein